jgi:hypothetical protein
LSKLREPSSLWYEWEIARSVIEQPGSESRRLAVLASGHLKAGLRTFSRALPVTFQTGPKGIDGSENQEDFAALGSCSFVSIRGSTFLESGA